MITINVGAAPNDGLGDPLRDAFISTNANFTEVVTDYAPLASPTFTGIPAGPTAAPLTNTTQFATTAFVVAAGVGIPWPYQYDVGLRQLLQGENPGATGDAVTAYGVGAAVSITNGTSNTVIGAGAGNTLSTGFANTIVGREAGYNMNADQSVIIGSNAGYNLTTSDRNTIIGSGAGYALDTGGGDNVLIGALAAPLGTVMQGTVAVGYGTLAVITLSTSHNTAIGYRALGDTTLNENTALGYKAGLKSNSNENIFIGSEAGAGSPLVDLTGDGNIIMGYLCGRTTQGAATNNVFIGRYAAETTEVTSESVIIGAGAGRNHTSSTSDQVIIGSNAGSGNMTGDNNIIIGHDAQPSSLTVSNEITIGNGVHDRFRLPGSLPAFDDDAAAGVGGILTNMLYQTTGAGAAPLNAIGIVMIKQ